MPANLPPQYHEVERKFREAKEPSEKLAFLREMYAVLPKHKGTDKLQADLKRRISKLQDGIQKSHKVGRRPYAFTIDREGAGQVVLLGAANSGKSSILKALTNAEPEVAAYPFTTRKPLPGMMPFEDIQVQLVDMPPVVADAIEHWFPQLVRSSDAALIVADVTSPTLLEDVDLVFKEMKKLNISLASGAGSGPASSQGQTLAAEAADAGEIKKALVVANKMDLGPDAETAELLREYLGGEMRIFPFSALTCEGAEKLKAGVFEMLSLVRIYTKIPGKKPDLDRPFVLPVNSTILDVANLVHKDFSSNLRFARIWGTGVFDGQCVERDHIVKDRDVIELHI